MADATMSCESGKFKHTKFKDVLKCDLCGKQSFSSTRDLTRHKNTVHFKVKPFACSQCEKRFGHISNLNEHIIPYILGLILKYYDYL